MNPPADFRLEPGDDAVVVAESLGTLAPLRLQHDSARRPTPHEREPHGPSPPSRILAAAIALGAWAGLLPAAAGTARGRRGVRRCAGGQHALHPTPAAIGQPLRAIVAASGLVALTLLGEAPAPPWGVGPGPPCASGLLGAIDLAGGALIGFGQGVLALWLVGGLILAGACPGWSGSAADSVILGAVNRVLPAPEGVATQIVGLLAPTGVPAPVRRHRAPAGTAAGPPDGAPLAA